MATESKIADGAAAGAPSPRVILGTMTFGHQTTEEDAAKQLQSFVSSHTGETRGRWEIDTARMYVHGKTEEILGRILDANPALRRQLIVASKVNPFKGYNETLRPDNVHAQAKAIREALKTECVDILYLHAPDIHTPIEATLEAVQELYVAGAFKELGLSNYPSWEVMYIWQHCNAKGYVKPTVYQGMFNAITRAVEQELLPCLRKLGMRFYAYNPLAGGMLTGKHTRDSTATDTRFDPSNDMYRRRFWRDSVFDALALLRPACEAASVPMAEASIRWLMHHSELSGGDNDGVIIGASSQGHLDANVAAANAGPLPAEVVAAFDGAWQLCKHDCPKYFRP